MEPDKFSQEGDIIKTERLDAEKTMQENHPGAAGPRDDEGGLSENERMEEEEEYMERSVKEFKEFVEANRDPQLEFTENDLWKVLFNLPHDYKLDEELFKKLVDLENEWRKRKI